jgi:hypothetical protein
LDRVVLGDAYTVRVESIRDLLEVLGKEIESLQRLVTRQLAAHQGFRAIQALEGVGPVLGAVFVGNYDVANGRPPDDAQPAPPGEGPPPTYNNSSRDNLWIHVEHHP